MKKDKSTKLTLDNGVSGEKLRVVRSAGQVLKMDQIVTLVLIVRDVPSRTYNKKASGVIVHRGEELPDENSLVVWDVDRFEKFS